MTFLDTVKAIPVTDLAERLGYSLVKKGRYYSLREHDSVMIDVQKNCFWRNSRFIKGFKGGAGSIIDFMMEFGEEPDYKAAMRRIALIYGIDGEKSPTIHYQQKAVQEITSKAEKKNKILTCKGVELPEKAKNTNQVFRYLLWRGISSKVIKYFLARKLLYEDVYSSCVFVSPHEDFACVRGTGKKRFLMDCKGSDYDRCFFFKGKANARTIIVAESVIDIMSIMTYLEIKGKWHGNYAYLALAGTGKINAIFTHLKQEPQINHIVLCLDQDEAGCAADERVLERLKKIEFPGRCDIKKPPVKSCKDWNDYIMTLQ